MIAIPRLTEILASHVNDIIEKYDAEYEMPQNQIKLGSVGKNVLAQKILHIPSDYLAILLMKYYFMLDDINISEITNRQHILGHLHYINELLCTAMRLPEEAYIHPTTIKNACRIAAIKYFSLKSSENLSHEYSSKFRKALKMIPAAQLPRKHNLVVIIGRRVAMVALVILITLTATLAVNAGIRARFFEWVRNTFPLFTEFGAAHPANMPDEDAYTTLLLLRPHYIPDGFNLFGEPFYSPSSVVRTYINDEGNMITFMAIIPDGTLTGFDTEGAIVEEVEFLSQTAFIWERQGITYFIWQQYGFECSLIAHLPKNTVFMIAESVKTYGD